jgi:hypothetical protein
VFTRRHAPFIAAVLALGLTLFVGLWAGLLVAVWLEAAGPPPAWVGRGLVWCWLFVRLAVMIGRAARRLIEQAGE